MVGWVGRRLLEHADDASGRGQVRITDAERDDIDARAFFLLNLAVDLGEEIRGDQVEAASAGTCFSQAVALTYVRIPGSGSGSISNHRTRASRRHHRSCRPAYRRLD